MGAWAVDTLMGVIDGSLPAGPVRRLLREKVVELARHVRHRRAEEARMALMDITVHGAYLAGRLRSNEPSTRRRA